MKKLKIILLVDLVRSDFMRENFEKELKNLHLEIETMGNMVIKVIDNSVIALTKKNTDLAKKIIAEDIDINNMEKKIESHCLNIILRENPVASDLRFISSVLKIITDLERIADQGADIAEISLYLSDEDFITPIVKIPQMANIAQDMVRKSLEAFINGDLSLATEVIEMDNRVDELFHCLKNHLIELIIENPKNGTQALDILMIGKYLERIGDHAENISEWVIYFLTGKVPNI